MQLAWGPCRPDSLTPITQAFPQVAYGHEQRRGAALGLWRGEQPSGRARGRAAAGWAGQRPQRGLMRLLLSRVGAAGQEIRSFGEGARCRAGDSVVLEAARGWPQGLACTVFCGRGRCAVVLHAGAWRRALHSQHARTRAWAVAVGEGRLRCMRRACGEGGVRRSRRSPNFPCTCSGVPPSAASHSAPSQQPTCIWVLYKKSHSVYTLAHEAPSSGAPPHGHGRGPHSRAASPRPQPATLCGPRSRREARCEKPSY
jgi:hypothetical protein